MNAVVTVALWYVVAIHLLAATFFLARATAKWTRDEHPRSYRITFLMAYLAVCPALGAARELRWVRVNIMSALALVSAVLGTLLLVFIWDAHFRGRRL